MAGISSATAERRRYKDMLIFVVVVCVCLYIMVDCRFCQIKLRACSCSAIFVRDCVRARACEEVRGEGCEFTEAFTQCNDLLSQCNYYLLVLIRKFAGNCSFAGMLSTFFRDFIFERSFVGK